MREEDFERLRNLLGRKKNVILQGAPGVGKSHAAQRLAYALMGEEDAERVKAVQFHQSYSYEDFMMGYRPQEEGAFRWRRGLSTSSATRRKMITTGIITSLSTRSTGQM